MLESRVESRALPVLPPLADWDATKLTLHLWVQIVGKIRMASSPPRNHWWHVPLYVDGRGLTTRLLQTENGLGFTIDFDFLDHQLRVRSDEGAVEGLPLHDGLSVAEFYVSLHSMLNQLGIEVPMLAVPYGIAVTTPFAADRAHASYDAEVVRKFWRSLEWSQRILEEFSGWYCGKTSPVHFFWHSFDLALTRFGGDRAPPLDDADAVTREAYSHDVISFGFWPGDEHTPQASFYSYTAPEPPTLRRTPLQPSAAAWVDQGSGSLARLAYEDVRSSTDPRVTLLNFLESAYRAGADAAGWNRSEFQSSWCPDSPAEISSHVVGTPDLRIENNTEEARYEAFAGSEQAGFTTYHAQPGLITLLHTEIDPAFEGQGIGSRFVAEILDDARRRELHVLPICPFVRAFLQKNPDYADLIWTG